MSTSKSQYMDVRKAYNQSAMTGATMSILFNFLHNKETMFNFKPPIFTQTIT